MCSGFETCIRRATATARRRVRTPAATRSTMRPRPNRVANAAALAESLQGAVVRHARPPFLPAYDQAKAIGKRDAGFDFRSSQHLLRFDLNNLDAESSTVLGGYSPHLIKDGPV